MRKIISKIVDYFRGLVLVLHLSDLLKNMK